MSGGLYAYLNVLSARRTTSFDGPNCYPRGGDEQLVVVLPAQRSG